MTLRLIVIMFFISVKAMAHQPGKRFLHMMAYDENNARVLLYGGASGGDTILSDLWSLKGHEWKRLSEKGPAPGIKSAFAYDANRKVAVLFGGSGDGGLLGETWEWNGETWTQINIRGPSPRNHPMAVYDPKARVMILFGGAANGLLSDTWTYDGKSWQLKNADGPKNCAPHGMFYDEARERVVMITVMQVAGNSRSKNEMWEWVGNTWKKLSYSVPSTSSQSLQALAPFGKGGIILFDGDDNANNKGKTWTFEGNEWSGRWLNGPSSRIGHGMVYDKANKRTVLFGGSNRKDIFDDLWCWDGRRWNML